MGLFDLISDVVSTTVKVAITPIAVVKDVVSVVQGEEPDSTKKLVKSAGDDLESAVDRITGEN